MDLGSLVGWSRAQFALTAMFHWLFVPLTLGLGIIMALAETKYYRTGKEEWKRWAKFWQKLFGINFAIGVATGLILEFQFGTNWSNYSRLVGDIFGAPLAIEGILAFFMEATFIAVMFFGWGKVSKGFHLASTWLTIIGATVSAVWILVANAWMQHPVGMEFNMDTMRSEMVDFWAVAFSPMAMNKFFHTVTSSWLLGAIFALGVCAFYLWRKRHKSFVLENVKIIAPFGLIAAVLTAFTGDSSGYEVAKHQPMKLAAFEAHYDAGASTTDAKTIDGSGLGLSAFGVIKGAEAERQAGEKPFFFNIKIPSMLSFMATRSLDGYVPGINNILEGGYTKPDGKVAIPVDSMMVRGRMAIAALGDYKVAKDAGNETEALAQEAIFRDNFEYFGYGYVENKADVVPNVPINYYAFRLMVGLGLLFILLFLVAWILAFRKKGAGLFKQRWFAIVAVCITPLAWVASQSGWIVAEMGRQPWAIQDFIPVQVAVSKLDTSSVVVTFVVFFALFTALLIAELNIMRKAIGDGPKEEEKVTDSKDNQAPEA